jgi:hypothetical protein
MENEYKFDVFLSYRRWKEWPEWVIESFFPIFEHWLGEELGRDPLIFVDQQIESGTSWPLELASALSRSKVLVPLLSRQYFTSNWCKQELAHMFAREKTTGFRTVSNTRGLILPAHLHDGDHYPEAVKQISAVQLQDCSYITIAKKSETAARLEYKIRQWVPDISAAIGFAPPREENWLELAADEFQAVFALTESGQGTPPRLL